MAGVALAVGAAIAEYVSTIGADRYIYDDFGPLVIGMMILSVAPYCSWASLVFAGVLASAVLSILVVGLVDVRRQRGADQRMVVVGAAPVLAMSAAAAAYSYAVVDQTLAWHREANGRRCTATPNSAPASRGRRCRAGVRTRT